MQCEEQVLAFVQRYIRNHTLPEEAIRRLFSNVRFMYLSNSALAKLAADSSVPKDMLLSGMAARLSTLDCPDITAAAVQPRSSYCSTVEFGLPGGSEYVTVPIEAIWEDLLPLLHVQVSGECRC